MVDDSMGDVRLAQEALKEARVANRLSIVHDGEQAMAFLRREDGYGDAPRPDLVLLDLNMPRMDGREVLAQIKGDPDLRTIPVVVLTTSEAEADIVKAYDLHANAYITKPVDLEAFLDAVRVVEEFWLTVVRLPGR
ncbi:MAG TPA: response regulator [Actinomycetota bacterium]